MRRKKSWLPVLVILISILACTLPGTPAATPFVFPTPGKPLFPSVTPGVSQGNNIPATTSTPTITPRVWPPPYFGSPGPTQVTPIPSPVAVFHDPDAINFLLIGSDRRTTSFRTDTLIVVNLQPKYNLITLISIPRDLFVYIPGWQMQRINTAYQHGISTNYPGGGPGLLRDTILYNLGIEIDFMTLVDFQGFENIIDTIGGVDVPVYCSYTDWRVINPNKDIEDENNWELYTVGPGVVHMDGDLALWYARSRKKSSDFDRGRRQQEVLRAIYEQALQLNMVTRIPALYQEVTSSVITDISLDTALSLVPVAAEIGSARIRSYYINTSNVTGWRSPQGASLLIPDIPKILDMLTEALGPPKDQEEMHLDTLVEVWNGTNHLDWDVLAAERLNYGGFEPQIGLADRRNYTQSILYDFTDGQNTNERLILLNLLGLSPNSVVQSPNPSSPVSYRLIIGSDYNPCFNPSKITR